MKTMERQDANDKTAQPKNDAYLGMLLISVAAMMVGSALLFVSYSRYPDKVPELPAAPRASTK
jgi:hypothetical protein